MPVRKIRCYADSDMDYSHRIIKSIWCKADTEMDHSNSNKYVNKRTNAKTVVGSLVLQLAALATVLLIVQQAIAQDEIPPLSSPGKREWT